MELLMELRMNRILLFCWAEYLTWFDLESQFLQRDRILSLDLISQLLVVPHTMPVMVWLKRRALSLRAVSLRTRVKKMIFHCSKESRRVQKAQITFFIFFPQINTVPGGSTFFSGFLASDLSPKKKSQSPQNILWKSLLGPKFENYSDFFNLWRKHLLDKEAIYQMNEWEISAPKNFLLANPGKIFMPFWLAALKKKANSSKNRPLTESNKYTWKIVAQVSWVL